MYRQLSVPEYWRFDPMSGDYYGRAIIGERLVNGQYEEFPVIEYPDGSIGSTGAILNLNFRWREWRFRIHNPATGEEYARRGGEIVRLNAEIARLREENRRRRGAG